MHNPRLWSPSAPNLYNIKISLFSTSQQRKFSDMRYYYNLEYRPYDFNIVLDVYETRFGFRRIEAKNSTILLNNEPIQLRGVNRHEAHPEFGPALPLSLILADIQLLKVTVMLLVYCNIDFYFLEFGR